MVIAFIAANFVNSAKNIYFQIGYLTHTLRGSLKLDIIYNDPKNLNYELQSTVI